MTTFDNARRTFLLSMAAGAALVALGTPPAAMAAQGLVLGPPSAFSFDGLVNEAQQLSRKPYQPAPGPDRLLVDQIDWAAHGQIHFKAEEALFAEGPGAYPIAFFPPGRFFPTAVRMYRLEELAGHTAAREIAFDKRLFEIPPDNPAQRLGPNAGFAGFRVQESRLGDQARLNWQTNDWVAFLGASYFRAIGDEYQYGLSARGAAVDVKVPGKAEEFPNFTRFYFAPAEAGSSTVTVYALLDGKSLTGAYRFDMTRGTGVVMDVSATLFLRQDVAQLGFAPITSMYWFSKTSKDREVDWRPEVHDSDGLALWTQEGEHVWRPLNDPSGISLSGFAANSPRGFGLLQRERRFDEYLDGVHYERRPSLWVEPLSDWGAGTVQLVELHTTEELYDNIVAMWVPQAPARAGARYDLHYRLHWFADEPFPSPLARCVATRLGRGGEPGPPRPAGVKKFVVEFRGGPLMHLPQGAVPDAVVSASRGEVRGVFTEPVPNGEAGDWRVQFDLAATGSEPVELHLYLRRGSETLSETWLYQYLPD